MVRKHNPNTVSLTVKTYDQNGEVEDKQSLSNSETVYAIVVTSRENTRITDHMGMTLVNLSTIAGGRDIPLFTKPDIIASGITDIIRRTISSKALQGFCLHEIAETLEHKAQVMQKDLTDKEKTEVFKMVLREYSGMKGGSKDEQ